ncbi:receptor kinase [Pelomyxa schiedti]|nr:receptor kinase [Pelomyxa schiedti]
MSRRTGTTVLSLISVEEVDALCDLFVNNLRHYWTLNPCSFTEPCQHRLNGVYCDSTGHVCDLELTYANMTGQLPASIGNLDRTILMFLDNNNLTGTIPDSFRSFTKLNSLYLSNNHFTGNIPDSIMLPSLSVLDLTNNYLTGSIPESITNLSDIGSISFFDNQLSGTIPDALGSLTRLYYILLAGNFLTGSIPDSLFSSPSLGALSLRGNKLTGTVPSTTWTSIYLDHNLFSSEIPSDWMPRLRSLSNIDLSGNQFRGDISQALPLSSLHTLDLSSNLFTGSPPNVTSRGLQECDVSQNCLWVDNSTSTCKNTPTKPVDMCACVADGTRCWVDGMCVTASAVSYYDPCLYCDPATTSLNWTASPQCPPSSSSIQQPHALTTIIILYLLCAMLLGNH